MQPSPSESSARQELTERDKEILDFEREWWQHPGHKEDAIRKTFQVSPARYYQLLGALLNSQQALAYDPMLIKRLVRQRDDRRKHRRNPGAAEQ